MRHFLAFEKPIAALEGRIEELRRPTDAGSIDVAEGVATLRALGATEVSGRLQAAE